MSGRKNRRCLTPSYDTLFCVLGAEPNQLLERKEQSPPKKIISVERCTDGMSARTLGSLKLNGAHAVFSLPLDPCFVRT